jgi:hypothetical protein
MPVILRRGILIGTIQHVDFETLTGHAGQPGGHFLIVHLQAGQTIDPDKPRADGR